MFSATPQFLIYVYNVQLKFQFTEHTTKWSKNLNYLPISSWSGPTSGIHKAEI